MCTLGQSTLVATRARRSLQPSRWAASWVSTVACLSDLTGNVELVEQYSKTERG
jgi:hypothetical protein